MTDDTTIGTIAEQIRRAIGDTLAPIADAHLAAGRSVDDVSDATAFGLVAMACTFASARHRSDCPSVRKTLHTAVDSLLDQLIAYDAGRINQAGETVQ